jgi:hypothetical protein
MTNMSISAKKDYVNDTKESSRARNTLSSRWEWGIVVKIPDTTRNAPRLSKAERFPETRRNQRLEGPSSNTRAGRGGQQSIHPMQPDDDRSKLIEMGGVWEAMKHQFVRKA